MAESFTLTVSYLRKTYNFEAELQHYGYTHKIVVVIDNVAIVFEPDEERNYRAVFSGNDKEINIDIGLLQAIAALLEDTFK